MSHIIWVCLNGLRKSAKVVGHFGHFSSSVTYSRDIQGGNESFWHYHFWIMNSFLIPLPDLLMDPIFWIP
jgi:hypothetical protein